jgi:Tol biopolymer transport system component
MNRIVYLTIFLFSIQFSCDSINPEEEEDRGILITSELNTSWLNLCWSKTSDELITGGMDGIQIIDINTKKIRALQDISTFALKLSNDGRTIYYLEGDVLQGDVEPLYVVSLDGQNKELLVEEVYVDCFCVCPQNLNVAYKSNTIIDEDSVYLFNTQTKTNGFLCKGVPKVFSPDGKHLICATSMDVNPEYFILNIETGERTPLSLELLGIDETYHSFVVTFKWLDDGIYILYSLGEPEIFYVHNVTANVNIYSWETSYSMHSCWSNDARKVAYWGWNRPNNNLYLADSEGVTNLVITKEFYVGNITFSPDNKRIAYVIGGSIYMKNISK